MSALFVILGLCALGYGAYSALVLPDKPLARGESNKAAQAWGVGVLVALAGALLLAVGISDSFLAGLVGFVVLGGGVVAAGAVQRRRMLTKGGGR